MRQTDPQLASYIPGSVRMYGGQRDQTRSELLRRRPVQAAICHVVSEY